MIQDTEELTTKQWTVVIVEDNDNVSKMIAKMLNDAGYQTKIISYGSAAVFYVLDNPSSLLLMDYYLPDMTAKDVICSLQANDKTTPFIIMSNPGNEKTIVEMMKMGARDFLVKEKGFMDLLPSAVARTIEQLGVEEKLLNVERSLQTSRDKFKHIFNSITDGIYISDLNGVLLEINDAAYLRLGIAGMGGGKRKKPLNYLEFRPYEFRQRYQSFVGELRHYGQMRYETSEVYGEDTSPVQLDCVSRIIEHEGKEAVLTISRDITEQKEIKDLLQQSENRFQRIANTISDYIVTVYIEDDKAVKTEHSPACEHVTGYTPADLEQRPFLWLEMVDLRDKEFVLENVNSLIKGENVKPFEHRIIRKDGNVVWLRNTPVLHFDNSNKLTSYDGVIQDITKQKLSEEKLLDQQAHLTATVKAFDGLVYISTPDYKVSFVNDKMIEKTGYDPTGQYCYKALYNREEICPWCANERVQKGETVRWENQNPEDSRWYSVVNIPVHHQDGRISKQALISDVTERKYAEMEINKLNNLYYGLMEEVCLPVCRFTPAGKIISANTCFIEMFGIKEGEEETVYEKLQPDLRGWTKEGIASMNGEMQAIKKRFKTGEGDESSEKVWTVKAVRNKSNEIIEYQGIVSDFTVELDNNEVTIPVKQSTMEDNG